MKTKTGDDENEGLVAPIVVIIDCSLVLGINASTAQATTKLKEDHEGCADYFCTLGLMYCMQGNYKQSHYVALLAVGSFKTKTNNYIITT
jgi:hypothetical protein